MLVGMYLHSVGNESSAVKHFSSVIKDKRNPAVVALAKSCCVLSELAQDKADSLSRAIDVLGCWSSEQKALQGFTEISALHFVSGTKSIYHVCSVVKCLATK